MNDQEVDAHRTHNLQQILDCSSPKRLIVAGPGTGKSYTFQKVAERVEGQVTALTFLNSLAAGLAIDLAGLADAATFHGWARSVLHRNPRSGVSADVDYYPPLPMLISDDLRCLGLDCEGSELDGLMMNLDEGDLRVAAGIARGNYYDAVSHTDSVFRVFRCMRAGEIVIPQYGQLLVDEYQDFNLLEVSLISLLAQASPTLIVGDDDQALYSFKHASARFIRNLAVNDEYERFELPYCTRCTEVLVAATHAVVERAQAAGLLEDRLEKPYTCFMPAKRELSELHPKIIHAHCSTEQTNVPYVCRYVAQQIDLIPVEQFAVNQEKGEPTVIIIGPGHVAKRVFEHLQGLGRTDIEFRRSTPSEVEAIDGYRRIAANPTSRLGWRIITSTHPFEGRDAAIAETESAVELVEVVPQDYRRRHAEVALLIQMILDHDPLTPEQIGVLEPALGMTYSEAVDRLCPTAGEPVPPPNILVTTLTGSKGLQADHVFVVGVNEASFPRLNNSVTDEEVCQLLVALTRAKHSCTLVSTGRFAGQTLKPSVFTEWLSDYVEYHYINKAYWT